MWTSAKPGRFHFFEYNAQLVNQRTYAKRYNNKKKIKWTEETRLKGGCLVFKGGDEPEIERRQCGIKRLGICAKGEKDDIESEIISWAGKQIREIILFPRTQYEIQASHDVHHKW